jgi:hypothetical protein
MGMAGDSSMPQYSKDILARRLEGLRLAGVSSAMEGLEKLPADAAALEAFARGEINEKEFMTRVSLSQPTPPSKHDEDTV